MFSFDLFWKWGSVWRLLVVNILLAAGNFRHFQVWKQELILNRESKKIQDQTN